MASGRFAETWVDSENEWARSLVQLGSRVSSAAPQIAPTSEPRPPSTTPVSSDSDSCSGNAPGWASCSTTASIAPPRPAQAALTG